MPTVAFIESNTTGTGRILAQKALARGYAVLFLSDRPHLYPYLRELLLHPRRVDTNDPEAICRLLRQEDDLVAVMSSSEYYLEVAAKVARELGLPGADPEGIASCRDKWRLRERLEAAGVSIPKTRRITSTREGRVAWSELKAPVVVKPASGTGSRGVRRHDTRETFEAHVAELLSITLNERGLPVEPVVLAQEFIEGAEYSVEMLGQGQELELLGITAKHLGTPPYFLEMGHDFPAPLGPQDAERIAATAEAALRAVGMEFGPTHTELRLRGAEPVILEINPRLAGGMIPVLIEDATGIDVLEALLDTFLGQAPKLAPSRRRTASIAFLIPERAGRLERITPPAETAKEVTEVFLKARPGDALVREGSFRDRIGHVIATGADAEESRALAESTRDMIAVRLAGEPTGDDTGQGRAAGAGNGETGQQSTGRLRRTLHPEAMEIVRKAPQPERRLWELRQLAAIDEAHLLMLLEENLLPEDSVRAVLAEVRTMASAGFPGIAESVAPRGTYLLYEGALIDRLGMDLGGITHLGRSRNDINACLFRLRLRDLFETAHRALWSLRSALLRRTAATMDVAMPVYSQFQPGLPGTLAYYLAGTEQALARDQQALEQLVEALDTCPMGAGAGGGSTFPIRPSRTAELLGFRSTCPSALDAVASRDLALRLLSTVAISGMHITRIAQDFQLWTTREHAFLELPDELAGGSSMMPQKKNPYLLEMIKGRATRSSGCWTNALANMQRTPFSNSVEVGTEAIAGLEEGLRDFCEAARLMALIVLGAKPNRKRMEQAIDDGVVQAAAVADGLVRQDEISFREAHHKVGAAVTAALDQGDSPSAAVEALLPAESRPTSGLGWAHLYTHGGGPGPSSMDQLRCRAEDQLDASGRWLHQCLAQWDAGEDRRQQAVEALLDSPQDR